MHPKWNTLSSPQTCFSVVRSVWGMPAVPVQQLRRKLGAVRRLLTPHPVFPQALLCLYLRNLSPFRQPCCHDASPNFCLSSQQPPNWTYQLILLCFFLASRHTAARGTAPKCTLDFSSSRIKPFQWLCITLRVEYKVLSMISGPFLPDFRSPPPHHLSSQSHP